MDVNTGQKQDLKLSSKYPQDKPNETIEGQTKKIPNLTFVGLAIGSMVVSAVLSVRKKPEFANFVGLWAPTFLIFGLYNKMVKVEDETLEGITRH